MEPPAKRLRILQSVEVDEENPEYIHAKQKQQRKFKGRLESIFAKYGSMHESMSDEIDMRENRVVVDRGHLRRLVRQVNRKETILLDNLGMAAGQDPEPEDISENEEENEYSEDELAPTQPPKSNKRRLEDTADEPHQPSAEPVAHSLPANTNQLYSQHIATPASATLQAGAQQVPGTPTPAANLLQLVQFPQTPAGEQAQNNFYTNLARTIDHAVQQAVIPLFSNILATTLNVQLPLTNGLPAPTTPVAISDKIAPATDPKWFFPPLSVESRKQHVAHSSPIPAPARMPVLENNYPAIEQNTSQQKHNHRGMRTRRASSQATNDMRPALTRSTGTEQTYSKPPPRRASPRVEIAQKSSVKRRRYNFTEEDDIYISRRKKLDKHTWSEIRKSKQKWEGWPEMVFSYRWNKHLKNKQLHLKEIHAGRIDYREPSIPRTAPCEGQYLEKEGSLPIETHHLPTPSSLEHDDRPDEAVEYDSAHIDSFMSSNAYFDDDERELLSLAGADTDEEDLPIAKGDEETIDATQEDTILPSVEMTEFIDEDTLQQGLLEDLPTEDAVPVISAAVLDAVKTEPMLSSPSSKRKRKTMPISFQAMPDSEDENEAELSDVDRSSAMTAGGTFLCDICQKTYKSAKNLEKHQANPRGTHDTLRPNSGSIDLIGDDEIQAPRTPYIKREGSTPPAASFVLSTPASQTPKSLPQHLGVHSSGSQSTPKLDRKTFLKQIKQSWAKKSTPTSNAVAKRRSFHTLSTKRAWPGDAESEDELAI
ncbi:Nn.00g056960.m01.CDS01 [Neocucurbitaria sp. VM-36]